MCLRHFEDRFPTTSGGCLNHLKKKTLTQVWHVPSTVGPRSVAIGIRLLRRSIAAFQEQIFIDVPRATHDHHAVLNPRPVGQNMAGSNMQKNGSNLKNTCASGLWNILDERITHINPMLAGKAWKDQRFTHVYNMIRDPSLKTWLEAMPSWALDGWTCSSTWSRPGVRVPFQPA